MSKMAQRQSLVTIEGISGRWATKTGGDISADTSPVWDGGEDTPEHLSSPAQADNVVLSRPFDDARDLPEIASLRRQVGKLRTTINEQHTNGDGYPIEDPTTYANALLVRLGEPAYDAASGDPKVIELEWAISQYV